MKIKLINGAQCPKQGRPGDAGYDFFLKDDVTIKAHTVTIIDSGICVELPAGHAGLLAMRSSVCKKNLQVHNVLQQSSLYPNHSGQL